MQISHNIKFPEIQGVEFYLAGGAVRDLLMGKQPKDSDFVMLTELSMEQIQDRIVAQGDVIYQYKPEFQILLCRIGGENVDLVFPREESGYSDGRHPDSTQRAKDLKTDSTRRDFTMNSMFMDKNGVVLDYQNGLEDLQNCMVKAVGNPEDRFKEDPLRILRAIRFASTMGFDIDEGTYEAMRLNTNLLCNPSVSVDRIKTEMNKAFLGNPFRTMLYIDAMDLMPIYRMRDEDMRIELVNRH